jgi:CHAT domain-containing protein
MNTTTSELLRCVAITITVLTAASCQNDGRVSLDEAKQITASFQPSLIKKPPRTTRDVLAVLSRYETAGSDRFQNLKTLADVNIGAPAMSAELASQLVMRADAARQLGRANQERNDLSNAVDILNTINGQKTLLSKAEFSLGMAHIRSGSFIKGRKIVSRILSSGDGFGATPSGSALAVEAMVRSGNLDEANELIDETNSVLPTLDQMPNFSNRQREALRIALNQGKASLLDLKGDLSSAEQVYRQAISSWTRYRTSETSDVTEAGEATRIANLLKIRLAENLRSQGRYVESELASRDSLVDTLKLNGRYSYQAASVLLTLAKTIFDQGRFGEALELARSTLEIYDRAGVSSIALNRLEARTLLGDIQVAAADWDEAYDTFSTLSRDLSNNTVLQNRFVNTNTRFAQVFMQRKEFNKAENILNQALTRFRKTDGDDGIQTLEAGALLGVLNSKRGNRETAQRLLQHYVPILLERKSSRDSGGNALHDTRLDHLLNEYLSMLMVADDGTIDPQAIAESFRLADGLRGRKLASALASSSTRSAIADPVLGDLVRREQDAQTQITALRGILADLLASPDAEQSTGGIAKLRSRLEALTAARLTLLDEIRDGFADYAELVRPRPMPLGEAAHLLKSDEVLIATYTSADRTYIWAVSGNGSHMAHVSSLGEDELSDLVSTVRGSLDPGPIASLGDLPEFNFGAARNIFTEILEPIRQEWIDARHIIVVPHGALATLPFSLLPTKPVTHIADEALLFEKYRSAPWLTRNHALTMLPSVGSLKVLRGTAPKRRATLPFVGFGDPYFSAGQALEAAKTNTVTEAAATRGLLALRSAPKTRGVDSATLALLPRLPDTASELHSIAIAMETDPNTSLYLGKRADEGIVKKIDLSNYRIISFATHGLVKGDLDGLDEPALALSSPEVTKNNEDGLLSASEILGLKLNAEWTVLSACNTAAADGEGAEAVSGLGRAFFYAGARAILVSNWPVHSGATSHLMSDLFWRQKQSPGLSRAVALQQSRLSMIDEGTQKNQNGKPLFSYAHPIFWAPFTIVGDGGGAKSGS